jgi:RNA polymerase sigma factor (sigma-70 family)
MYNRVVDAYRARRPAGVEIDEDEVDARYDLTMDLERAEDQLLLELAIEELPEAQRAVLVATELEGRAFRELAAEWQVPIGTLLARKHRAVAALKKALGGGE